MYNYGPSNEALIHALVGQDRANVRDFDQNNMMVGPPDLSGLGMGQGMGLPGDSYEQRDTDMILRDMNQGAPETPPNNNMVPEPFQFFRLDGGQYQPQPGRNNIHEMIQNFIRSLQGR